MAIMFFAGKLKIIRNMNIDYINSGFKYVTRTCLTLLFAFFIFLISSADEQTSLFELAKKGVVSIEKNVHKTAYGNVGRGYGTGFLVDKDQGIILTNKHIAAKKDIANYEVTFYNGRKTAAKFLYNDPHIDFAFLKIDPSFISEDIHALKLSKKEPVIGQKVFATGNNQRQEFSIQEGVVVSKYKSIDIFPYQNIVVSLNTKGGSSGSPILDKKGQVLGLIFSGDATYTNAVKISYITDALELVKKHKTPPRKGIEGIVSYYSLDDSVKFLNFPKELVSSYVKRYPDSLNNILVVNSLYKGTKTQSILQPGDIIWSVDGKEIGPDLYKMQKIMNDLDGYEANLGVYRNGKLMSFKVPLYDLEKANDISKMVVFGGAAFFESDDMFRILSGVNLKTVFVSNMDSGSSFDNLPYFYWEGGKAQRIGLVSLGEVKINNLIDLIEKIPLLKKRKNFLCVYNNYFVQRSNYNHYAILSNRDEFMHIQYSQYDREPVVFEFNAKENIWEVRKVIE